MDDINFHIKTKVNDKLSDYFSFDYDKNRGKLLKIIIKTNNEDIIYSNKNIVIDDKIVICNQNNNKILIIFKTDEKNKLKILNDIFNISHIFEMELKTFANYSIKQIHKIISTNSLNSLIITCNDYVISNKINPRDPEDNYKFNYFPNSLTILSVFDFNNLLFLPNKIKKLKIYNTEKHILQKLIKKIPFNLNCIESLSTKDFIKFSKIQNIKIML